MPEISPLFNPSVDDTDLCARSGLNRVMMMQPLYVINMSPVVTHYKRIFGDDSVNFEGDDAVSIKMDQEVELFIQRVETDSVFAELVGTQSIGAGLTAERYACLATNLDAKVPLTLDTWSGGPHVDEGFMVLDPEGNRMLLMPVHEPAGV